MLELYYFPTATCGYKARLTLAEKGVDFVHRVLDRDAGALTTPEYLALNPNAVVPTLVHDGEVLIESSIIMVYIDEAFDGHSLRGRTALDHARAAAWLKRADDRYLGAVGALTYGTFRRKEVLRKSPADLQAYYEAIPDADRRNARRSVVEQGIAAREVRHGVLTLDKMLNDLDLALAGARFLTGHEYGLADAALTPFVSRLSELSLDWMWRTRSNVARWWAQVQDRASFTTVFDAYPNPERVAALRAAGEEARESIRSILAAP